eukprot:1678782-Rhodomonas_salina.1
MRMRGERDALRIFELEKALSEVRGERELAEEGMKNAEEECERSDGECQKLRLLLQKEREDTARLRTKERERERAEQEQAADSMRQPDFADVDHPTAVALTFEH